MTRIAYVFPGQGSQQPGMGAPWTRTPSWRLVARASEASGRDVAGLLLDTDADTLRRTDNAQLATFVLACVAHAEIREALPGAAPAAVAGHSLGEYTALVAAGVLDFEDGVRLVAERGRAMRDACATVPGTMGAVLGLDTGTVARTVEDVRRDGARVWVANINSPLQTVLSGTVEGVARASDAVLERGASRVVGIPVGGAFHTPLMAPARERLGLALDLVVPRPAAVPVVANVDAAPHTDAAPWPALLREQLTAPVRWLDTVRTLTGALGADLLVEPGPGRVLSGFTRRIAPAAGRVSVGTPDDITALAERTGVLREDGAPVPVSPGRA
ncbi:MULTISPECIES: ACP S-malonyltransferase [unclassified Nocardiopsis]|uniref:ACP S-malonyltransferase n=1 Tax=Nocardiopsis TaxID=2013 RepID=UPI00387B4502